MNDITNPEIPIEALRALLSYDPNTGVLTWKRWPWTPQIWQFEGKTAGTEKKGEIQIAITYAGKTRTYRAHRVCWALYYGEWPDKLIDHWDNDTKNNRISNLRKATNSNNSCNKKDVVGKIPWKGVYLFKGKHYGAQIKLNHTHYWLGLHSEPWLAAMAYDAKAKSLHGAFAKTNYELLETIFEKCVWLCIAEIIGVRYA
jgi:hypothetical protein